MIASKPYDITRGKQVMTNWLDRIKATIYLICLSVFMQTQSSAATLDNISYSSLPGDRVQLVLELSEPVGEKPLSFTIDNPARIVLDFPGTTLNVAEKNQSIGIGVAHSVSAVEAAGRTRVVLNLVRSVAYDMEVQGNKVNITLAAAAVASTDAGQVSAAQVTGGGTPSASRIENIDFRRGESGEGKIVVTLSDPSIGVNMGQEAGQIVIDFLNTNLPEELNRRLDVIDFATPVKEVDTSPHGNGARMIISTTTQDYDHLAYQSDNLLTIEVKPLSKEEKEAIQKKKGGYTGERLSLNFQDIEVRAVLQLIADFTGLNMVASDSVAGNVTLRLKNVPWDQALDIILKSKGLGIRKDGNVIMVAPQEEIAAREKLELEASKQIEELAPLHTEFLQVNYAKAGELASLIKAEENNLLSERGNVTIDERTNTLIIQDVAATLESIRQMVDKLDIPVRQVLIESRIVNADESFSKDLGVNFGFSKATRDDPREGVLGGEGESGLFLGGGQAGNTNFGDGTAFVTGDNENLMVTLPVAGATGSLKLAYGIIGSYLLQLELSAALAEGRGEDIASPKVITANQREAVIESGVEIPFQEASSSGATSVSFKKAVLALRVTPQITPDDRILLDLKVNQDTRGSPDVLGVPPINTRNVSTQVLVDNGETVVLGGVYSQTNNRSSDRIPFFGDLPYVGFLFKRTSEENTKTELLIFVTPKILKENLQI
ncbi:MAG: type pilus assembly protein PilQ [Gammaproteobacteria bacterium]|nr:type pilus assembly protein PilQ [Gammaproteobacteria bacterium]